MGREEERGGEQRATQDREEAGLEGKGKQRRGRQGRESQQLARGSGPPLSLLPPLGPQTFHPGGRACSDGVPGKGEEMLPDDGSTQTGAPPILSAPEL